MIPSKWLIIIDYDSYRRISNSAEPGTVSTDRQRRSSLDGGPDQRRSDLADRPRRGRQRLAVDRPTRLQRSATTSDHRLHRHVDPQAVGLGVAAAVFIDIEQHDWRTLRTESAAIPGVVYRRCAPAGSISC